MNFRSFAAVNGLRPPEAARERAIDGGKTSETTGFHEADGALCRVGALEPLRRQDCRPSARLDSVGRR